jgi:hypothetical protein
MQSGVGGGSRFEGLPVRVQAYFPATGELVMAEPRLGAAGVAVC